MTCYYINIACAFCVMLLWDYDIVQKDGVCITIDSIYLRKVYTIYGITVLLATLVAMSKFESGCLTHVKTVKLFISLFQSRRTRPSWSAKLLLD